MYIGNNYLGFRFGFLMYFHDTVVSIYLTTLSSASTSTSEATGPILTSTSKLPPTVISSKLLNRSGFANNISAAVVKLQEANVIIEIR